MYHNWKAFFQTVKLNFHNFNVANSNFGYKQTPQNMFIKYLYESGCEQSNRNRIGLGPDGLSKCPFEWWLVDDDIDELQVRRPP